MFIFRSSPSILAPWKPMRFLFNPSLDETSKEMMELFFLKSINSLYAPFEGMSFELKFKWMMDEFFTKALHIVEIPRLDNEFLARFRWVNLEFFLIILLNTWDEFQPSCYSERFSKPPFEVFLIFSINFAACSGR